MYSKRIASILSAGVLLMPLSAFAHEHQMFQIGEKRFVLTVGSLNEPLIVDDKSGVELMVGEAGEMKEEEHDDSQPHEETTTPVEGLEKTLKVEVSAGDKKKIFDLSPVYGEKGSYKAVFFPTVQTTLTYRFFGTINSVPVDLSFTCNPAGHPVTPEDKTPVTISEGVTRLEKAGAFGCPIAKADMGFPEPAVTLQDLAVSETSSDGMDTGILGLVAGVAGLILGGVALARTKKPSNLA